MNLYEIKEEMYNLINEDGEIVEYEKFKELKLAKDEKIENMALWIKNLLAEAKAIKEEEKILSDRRKSLENRAESLKKYTDMVLNGQKFSTSKVSISYRKSTPLEVEDGFIEWAKKNNNVYLKFTEPKVDAIAVKEDLASGREIPFAKIVEKQNIQIK